MTYCIDLFGHRISNSLNIYLQAPNEIICHLPCISKYSLRGKDLLILSSDFVPDPQL